MKKLTEEQKRGIFKLFWEKIGEELWKKGNCNRHFDMSTEGFKFSVDIRIRGIGKGHQSIPSYLKPIYIPVMDIKRKGKICQK